MRSRWLPPAREALPPDKDEDVRIALAFEFFLQFVLLPAVLALHPVRWWPLPLLWVLAFYCYIILRRAPDFNARAFWRADAIAAERRSILTLFLPSAGVLALGVYVYAPQLFLSLPRRFPLIWCLILVLYPALSVVPQTIVYRAFVFDRYRPLFPGKWAIILASGAAFSWLHIALRNPLAPVLTFPGGILFAWRYQRTESVTVSALEHALYGCLIFTLGLGTYFYSGGVR